MTRKKSARVNPSSTSDLLRPDGHPNSPTLTVLGLGADRTGEAGPSAPRRFVWNPTLRIAGRSRARWACGQAAFGPVHMSTGLHPGVKS